jgi:hypothetical protein
MKNICAQKKSAQTLTIWARQNLHLLTSSKSGWRALVQVMLSLLHTVLKWDLHPGRLYGRRLCCTVPAVVPAWPAKIFASCPNICSDQYPSTGRTATLCRIVICTSVNTTWRTAGLIHDFWSVQNLRQLFYLVPLSRRFRIIRCKRQAALHSALFNYTPLVIRRTDKNKHLLRKMKTTCKVLCIYFQHGS